MEPLGQHTTASEQVVRGKCAPGMGRNEKLQSDKELELNQKMKEIRQRRREKKEEEEGGKKEGEEEKREGGRKDKRTGGRKNTSIVLSMGQASF